MAGLPNIIRRCGNRGNLPFSAESRHKRALPEKPASSFREIQITRRIVQSPLAHGPCHGPLPANATSPNEPDAKVTRFYASRTCHEVFAAHHILWPPVDGRDICCDPKVSADQALASSVEALPNTRPVDSTHAYPHVSEPFLTGLLIRRAVPTAHTRVINAILASASHAAPASAVHTKNKLLAGSIHPNLGVVQARVCLKFRNSNIVAS
jgi:hypothetical protein